VLLVFFADVVAFTSGLGRVVFSAGAGICVGVGAGIAVEAGGVVADAAAGIGTGTGGGAAGEGEHAARPIPTIATTVKAGRRWYNIVSSPELYASRRGACTATFADPAVSVPKERAHAIRPRYLDVP
jgi:hypothetical protein